MTTYTAENRRNLDLAMLVLRLVVGVIMAVHGYQKVFVFGIKGVTGMFASMHVIMPMITAPLISVLEFFGGIAIILGLFTRVVGFLLACDMLGAMIFVHARNGFAAPKGIEAVLGNFGMSVALALVGAGLYSLDAMIARRRGPTQ